MAYDLYYITDEKTRKSGGYQIATKDTIKDCCRTGIRYLTSVKNNGYIEVVEGTNFIKCIISCIRCNDKPTYLFINCADNKVYFLTSLGEKRK